MIITYTPRVERNDSNIFTARCTLVQSAVLRSHSGVFRMCERRGPGVWGTEVPQWIQGQSPGRESGGRSPPEADDFYRAMHFSAKRGIAIACRLSVCLSVCPSVWDVGEL